MIIDSSVDLKPKPKLNMPTVIDYSEQLVELFRRYIIPDVGSYSEKADKKAKDLIEKIVIYRNDKTILTNIDYLSGRNIGGIDIGNKTKNILKHYTRCIMHYLGEIAECVVINRCITSPECNMTFINIAKLMPNIREKYSEVAYEKYVPFSPSHKYLFYEEKGILVCKKVFDRNMNHETKDIGWCEKENSFSQLKTNIPEIKYLENAKIQIKTTLDPLTIRVNKYITTPIVVFNINEDYDDLNELKRRYPKHYILDAKDVDPVAFTEVSNYFKILASYICGFTSSIKIGAEMLEDQTLQYLFRTPIKELLNYKPFSNSGIIDLWEEYKKPIEVLA